MTGIDGAVAVGVHQPASGDSSDGGGCQVGQHDSAAWLGSLPVLIGALILVAPRRRR